MQEVAKRLPRSLIHSLILAQLLSSTIAPGALADEVDAETVAEHLAGAIRFPTISPADPGDFDGQPFIDLAAYLRETYPLVHQRLDVEVVADYSLLYTWRGSRPERDAALFMSHLDVVPVEAGTEELWQHPPFSGAIEEGHVWGRGALDIKCGVITWLEAAEALLAEGFVPERTVYLAFGHDEELGGTEGAASIAKTLEDRGARIALLFDEGGSIADDNSLLPGVPVAMVFVAEKAYLTLRLTAHGRGGHSSIPPRHTSIGKLASAIHRIEENPMPPRLTDTMRAMLEASAPHQSFLRRFAFNNLWLTKGTILRSLLKDDLQRVMVQTSTAATVIHGGVKDNVVPESAEAMVNFRLLPGDTPEGVIEHVRSAIDDPDIDIESLGWSPAPPPAAIDGPAFEVIRESVNAVVPDAVILPALLPGATDTRHYTRIAEDVYRFVPVRVGSSLMESFHGRDERIGVAHLGEAVEMAKGMVRRSASLAQAP
ncbi:MAG: M20/M25/M40 family metallo-hydrolase [Deltaproteobacteria bacterium]|nr:M20/M25/M40 family metallo-hydrolase [Deltaproteobacteria bacterium]